MLITCRAVIDVTDIITAVVAKGNSPSPIALVWPFKAREGRSKGNPHGQLFLVMFKPGIVV